MRAHFEEPAWGGANHVALSPLLFLQRAATVNASFPATSFGAEVRTWAEVALRVRCV